MRPFEGIRVLDFTRIVSGPYCTQMLAYLGAEIIKIEDRDGGDAARSTAGDPDLKKEGLAATYIMFNSGKKSVTLDLKKPEAKEIIYKLARAADVVVENFRAGVIDRLGFGYERLKQENPKLIFCSISGFGQTGPDSRAPAFDGNIQAMSGMMAVTGEEDGPPMRAGYSVADTSTGVNAALAISAALYQRMHTGLSQYIDVAMLDSAMLLMSQTSGAWLNGRIEQKRRADLSVNYEPTADVFGTADGSLMLMIMRDKHVEIFLRALGLGRFIDDPRFATRQQRVANTGFIKPLIEAEMKKKPSGEWKRLLDEAGVPCSLILDLPQALSQPQVVHRGLVRETTDARTGKVMRTLDAPFKYAHGGPAPSIPPQRLGSQTAEVLTSLGYSEREIADLAKREII